MQWLVGQIVILLVLGVVIAQTNHDDESVIIVRPHDGEEIPFDTMTNTTDNSSLIRSVI